MEQLNFAADLQCPDCSRVIRRSQIPSARLHRAALALWIAVIPANVVWIGVFLGIVIPSFTGGDLIPQVHSLRGALVMIATTFWPTFLLVALAMTMPRVRVVKCPYCSWSETKVLPRRKV